MPTTPPAPEPRSEGRLPVAAIVGGLAVAAAIAFLVLRPSATEEPARAPGDRRTAPSAMPTTLPLKAPPGEDGPEEAEERGPALPDEARAPADADAAAKPDADLDPDEIDANEALAAIRHARNSPGRDGTEALLAAMLSDDAVVVAEAGKALVQRDDTQAIPALAKIDLRKSGGAGLSVIETLGKLAGKADGGDKSAAVDRLLQMLAQEKQHGGPETPGNLLQIYEALGDTRDARAAGALERELADPGVERAPKVVVVQALAKIAAPSSRAALLRARNAEQATKLEDAFEAELQRDLLKAIEEALAKT